MRTRIIEFAARHHENFLRTARPRLNAARCLQAHGIPNDGTRGRRIPARLAIESLNAATLFPAFARFSLILPLSPPLRASARNFVPRIFLRRGRGRKETRKESSFFRLARFSAELPAIGQDIFRLSRPYLPTSLSRIGCSIVFSALSINVLIDFGPSPGERSFLHDRRARFLTPRRRAILRLVLLLLLHHPHNRHSAGDGAGT